MKHTVSFYGRIVNDCVLHGPTERELNDDGVCDACRKMSPTMRQQFLNSPRVARFSREHIGKTFPGIRY